MTTKVAINGFGRIGRLTFRAALESARDDLEFVAINDLSDAAEMAYLLKWDSVHRQLPMDVSVEGEDTLVVSGKRVRLLTQPDPTKLPWGELGVDVVMECTGRFTKKDSAGQHLAAGAKKVLISAPCGDADRTIVDLKARREITGDWLQSKCGWSPFEGLRVTGWPMATILRGRIVMREGELAEAASGQAVRFLDSL